MDDQRSKKEDEIVSQLDFKQEEANKDSVTSNENPFIEVDSNGFNQGKRVVDSLLRTTPKYEPFISESDAQIALDMARQVNYCQGEAKSLLKLAILYSRAQKEINALESIEKAKNIFEICESQRNQMTLSYVLTETYRNFNYYKEALDQAELTLTLAKEFKDTLVQGKVLWNIASVHDKIDQRDKFSELAGEALSIFRSKGHVSEIVNVYTRLGILEDDLEQKLEYFEKAKRLLDQIENSWVRKDKSLRLYSYIAHTHLDNKDYVASETACNLGLEIAKETGNVTTQAMLNAYLSDIHFYHYTNYEEALKFAEAHYEYERSISRYYYVIPAAQHLLKIHKEAGNNKKALEYADTAMLYQDSLYWANRKDDAEDIKEAYELEQRLSEVYELRIQRRIRTIVGLSTAAFLLLLSGFLWWQRNTKIRNLQLQKEYSNKLQKEKDTIRNQNEQLSTLNDAKDKLFTIIGHDLRGPMFSLQGLEEQIDYLLETKQYSRLKDLGFSVGEQTGYISNTLNNLLNWSITQQGIFPFKPENVKILDIVNEVFQLFERNATLKKIQLIQDIDKDLFAFVDRNAFHTILRNLLSNAIKFTPSGGEIAIRVYDEGDMAILELKDNGVGMALEKVDVLGKSPLGYSSKGTIGESGSGLGLRIVNDLVTQNNGKIDFINAKTKGIIVIIAFPNKNSRIE